MLVCAANSASFPPQSEGVCSTEVKLSFMFHICKTKITKIKQNDSEQSHLMAVISLTHPRSNKQSLFLPAWVMFEIRLAVLCNIKSSLDNFIKNMINS